LTIRSFTVWCGGSAARPKPKRRSDSKQCRKSQPQRKASELALLLMDGWFARFRGPGWGKRTPQKERVEWHEIKNGVFYLHEQAGQTQAKPKGVEE